MVIFISKKRLIDTSFISLDFTPLSVNTSQNNPSVYICSNYKGGYKHCFPCSHHLSCMGLGLSQNTNKKLFTRSVSTFPVKSLPGPFHQEGIFSLRKLPKIMNTPVVMIELILFFSKSYIPAIIYTITYIIQGDRNR